jgi:hypothetical protein
MGTPERERAFLEMLSGILESARIPAELRAEITDRMIEGFRDPEVKVAQILGGFCGDGTHDLSVRHLTDRGYREYPIGKDSFRSVDPEDNVLLVEESAEWIACPRCNGAGEVLCSQDQPGGRCIVFTLPCDLCLGTGRIMVPKKAKAEKRLERRFCDSD